MDSEGITRFGVGSDGGIGFASKQGADFNIKSGGSMRVDIGSGEEEMQIAHGDATTSSGVVMRVRGDKIFSHVPADLVEVISPSDRRIKRKILDIDEDDLLQRMQKLRVTSYQYSDEWQKVRGIEDIRVRGVIAQEVYEEFPEYITITEKMEFKDKGFELKNFHEVNKIRISIDLLAAVQAQHRRLTIGPNDRNGARSGNLDLNSARGGLGGFNNATDASSSGDVTLRSGNAEGSLGGDSGAVLIASGSSMAGQAGSISVKAGSTSGQDA